MFNHLNEKADKMAVLCASSIAVVAGGLLGGVIANTVSPNVSSNSATTNADAGGVSWETAGLSVVLSGVFIAASVAVAKYCCRNAVTILRNFCINLKERRRNRNNIGNTNLAFEMASEETQVAESSSANEGPGSNVCPSAPALKKRDTPNAIIGTTTNVTVHSGANGNRSPSTHSPANGSDKSSFDSKGGMAFLEEAISGLTKASAGSSKASAVPIQEEIIQPSLVIRNTANMENLSSRFDSLLQKSTRSSSSCSSDVSGVTEASVTFSALSSCNSMPGTMISRASLSQSDASHFRTQSL